MKKSLQLLFALLLCVTFSSKVWACDPPTDLRYQIEEDVPGYGYKFRVTLSWNLVDGASFYSVYFYNNNYPDGIWFGDSDGSYYIAGANTEGTFEFSVVSHCSDGSISERSERCTVVIESGATPCMTPSNLQAVVEEDVPGSGYNYTITLTWDPVENAEKYEVYLNNDILTNTTENTYTLGIGTPQVLYFAVATICQDGGESPISPNIMVNVDPCLPPTNLQAEVEEDVPGFPYKYKVTLTWDANNDANSYTIYENGAWKGYSSETMFEIGYNAPTTVFFNVTSSCVNGESDMTDPLTVVVEGNGDDNETCPTPTNLGAIVEKDVEGYQYVYKVTMTWDAVEEAGGYKVFVNGSEFGATSTNFYIAGSDNEGEFEFSVVALCPSGESEESEPYTVVVKDESLEEYANRFEIYPNPAESNITINTNENINEINIYNIIGINVYSEKASVDRCPLSIDINALNSGVYFIKINTEKGDIVKRFVKE